MSNEKSKASKKEKAAFGAAGAATLGLGALKLHGSDTVAGMQTEIMVKNIAKKHHANGGSVASFQAGINGAHKVGARTPDVDAETFKTLKESDNILKAHADKTKQRAAKATKRGHHEIAAALNTKSDALQGMRRMVPGLRSNVILDKIKKPALAAIGTLAATGGVMRHLRKKKEKEANLKP